MSAADAIPVASIAEAKGYADGIMLGMINPAVATAASTTFSDGSYYLEEQDRSSAIKVVPEPGLQPVAVGDGVIGSGMTRTDVNGERYLRLMTIASAPGAAMEPLFMTNKAVISALDPAGLLVTTWGKLISVEPVTPPQKPAYAYIDDGSGLSLDDCRGIKVILSGLNTPIANDLNCTGILVTGLLSRSEGAYGTMPVIRPRGDSDIISFEY